MTLLSAAMLLLFPAPAMADCTDPNGKEGEMRYNSDYKAFQGCAGSTWVAFHDVGDVVGGPTTGLLGYYKLDETSGTDIYDSSGNGYHGTFNGAPAVTPAASGPGGAGAIEFTTATNVTIGDDAYDNLPEFTACAWVNRPSSPTAAGFTGLMGKNTVGTNGWDVYGQAGNGVFGISVPGAGYKQPGGVLDADTWVHVCASWDGNYTTSSMKLYRNGVEVSPGSGSSYGSIQDDAANDVFIGGTSSYDFDGGMAGVRIYNRVLTDPEVLELYNLGY